MRESATLLRWLNRAAAWWPVAAQRERLRLASLNLYIDGHLSENRTQEAFRAITVYLNFARDLDAAGRLSRGQRLEVTLRQAELASILCENGRPDQGAPLLEEALQDFRRYDGVADEFLGACLLNLGGALLRAGRAEESVGWLAEAKELRARLHGAESQEAGQCHTNLGIAYQELGEYPDALSELEQSVRIHAAHNQAGEDYAIALHNLGALLILLERPGEAQGAIMRAALLFEQRGHPLLSNALDTLADAYSAQGRARDAFLARERALNQLRDDTLHSVSTADWLQKQAQLLEQMNQNEEAAHYREWASDVRRKVAFRSVLQDGTLAISS
ncbi:MAG: tetratricopeptide repeat protein [Bryobacteraceae bacterium]|nr:tetratricopeptide repeat protein [Bryobacteraceae bacterium]